jgi:glutamate N-acetyltransferase/amino-acid N-acetyltransferase
MDYVRPHQTEASPQMAHECILPKGFQVAGTTAGIKRSGQPDLALFVSAYPATAAGVFTQNRVCGAPVIVSRERVPRTDTRAVVINSGNANACTGEQGISDAREMTSTVAASLGCSAEQVLICSTGIIGVPLPVSIIVNAVPRAVEQLSVKPDALERGAVAMMTTDTFPKMASESVTFESGDTVRIAAVAKGAAMIAPNMATMLAVVMTDASLTTDQAAEMLNQAVSGSFNCISVDGHTSTSDTVFLLANGASGTTDPTAADTGQLRDALGRVCQKLATDIIRDAEGADHFITIDAVGFETQADAAAVARQVADSALVKTAVAGADPNWGRIVSAAGYAGVPFETQYVTLRINNVVVYEAGVPTSFDADALSSQLREHREVSISLQLDGGPASGSQHCRFWTSDLTTEYVRLNSEYTT